MEKEFVSYEQAVVLKELGFDEECMADYMGFACDFKDGEYITTHEQIFYPNDSITPYDLAEELDRHPIHICGIPLKQQVFRWFREKYNLHIDIYPFEIFESDAVVGYKYFYSTYHIIECYANRDEERLGHTTYEEAENACIDKLILIAKQQDNGK